MSINDDTIKSDIEIRVEFSGGLELLFSDVRELSLSLPINSTISDLIRCLSETKVDSHKKELFVLEGSEGTVRPGILVLINDVDWEIEGEGEYILQARDCVMFVSTLHGG